MSAERLFFCPECRRWFRVVCQRSWCRRLVRRHFGPLVCCAPCADARRLASASGLSVAECRNPERACR